MAKFNHSVEAYLEYAKFLPIVLVLADAVKVGSDWESQEAYGEQITEIASERALAGMRDTAMSDAVRIWNYQRKQAALRRFAEVAPMHREACLDFAEVMPV